MSFKPGDLVETRKDVTVLAPKWRTWPVGTLAVVTGDKLGSRHFDSVFTHIMLPDGNGVRVEHRRLQIAGSQEKE